MASKTSFFNGTIYKKTLKRFFPWSICCALLLFLQTPLSYILEYRSIITYSSYTNTQITEQLGSVCVSGAAWTTVFIFFAALLAAGLIYGFLYKPSAVNMLHALPVTKPGLLFTNFCAGMTLLAAPLLLDTLLAVLFLAAVGAGSVAVIQLLLLPAQLLITLFFFAVAAFCCTLSGIVLVMPVIYAIVNFLSVGVWALLTLFQNMFLYGLRTEFSHFRIFSVFSPILRLTSDLITQSEAADTGQLVSLSDIEIHWQYPLLYGLVGIGILLLSMWLYRIRKAEHAGDTLAFPKTAWIFQTLGAIAAGAFSVLLLYSYNSTYQSDFANIAAFLVGGVLGFVVIYMFVRKKFNVFREVWKSALLFAAAAAAILFFLHLDVFGIENYLPDTDEIASVSFTATDTAAATTQEEIKAYLRVHAAILDEKDLLEETIRDNSYDVCNYIGIEYQLKSGKTVSRSYEVPVIAETVSDDSSALMQYYDILNEPENIRQTLFGEDFSDAQIPYMTVTYWDDTDGYSVALSDDERTKLMEAILADIDEGNLIYSTLWTDQDLTFANPAYNDSTHTYYEQSLEITLYDKDSYAHRNASANGVYYDEVIGYASSINITLETTMTHTISCLEELGYVTQERPLTRQPTVEYYD